MATTHKAVLAARKRILQDLIKPLQEELDEIEELLKTKVRHSAAHEDGCRCRECDPSW
jgi:hypothetical protein